MAFRKIDISELSFNPFDKIGKQWMLLTGGNSEKYNTMTASWGQLGVLWNKNVLTCYIRPNRYTYSFIEKEECFTASFFGEEYRKALSFCGSHSGRDCDKAKETGLTPAEIDGCMSFAEAELVLVCRKLYSYDLQESGFLTDDGIPAQFFGSDPYHRAYISEITGVYVKE
ncbi:MAG: flavin reductase [Ruminococcus sp.]|uniref:flavin reductase n=1 Tax=Ruminococcus sp. TaxID=41978 RepID=UPI0025F2D446|nr:flavin reductase [Ruminococcus sp.]MBR5683837.1 flavin reductase [Ruminococcus sp.]